MFQFMNWPLQTIPSLYCLTILILTMALSAGINLFCSLLVCRITVHTVWWARRWVGLAVPKCLSFPETWEGAGAYRGFNTSVPPFWSWLNEVHQMTESPWWVESEPGWFTPFCVCSRPVPPHLIQPVNTELMNLVVCQRVSDGLEPNFTHPMSSQDQERRTLVWREKEPFSNLAAFHH